MACFPHPTMLPRGPWMRGSPARRPKSDSMKAMQMDRRSFLAGAAGTAAQAQTADAAARPNILHIMTDQQQWATIAGRSGCRTPNIDRLAREGMIFERSY